jgi:putative transcriptional regulator
MKLTETQLFCTLRAHRRLAEMTQEELAAAVGVSRQTIAAVEKGTYNPSVVLALRCAEVFQVGVEDLFTIRDRQASVFRPGSRKKSEDQP